MGEVLAVSTAASWALLVPALVVGAAPGLIGWWRAIQRHRHDRALDATIARRYQR